MTIAIFKTLAAGRSMSPRAKNSKRGPRSVLTATLRPSAAANFDRIRTASAAPSDGTGEPCSRPLPLRPKESIDDPSSVWNHAIVFWPEYQVKRGAPVSPSWTNRLVGDNTGCRRCRRHFARRSGGRGQTHNRKTAATRADGGPQRHDL